MSGLDHSKRNGRDRIARKGEDSIRDDGLPAGLNPPKPRPSKAALRAQLVDAEARITRIVSCACGHRATVAIPAAWVGTKMLRCSQCDARFPV